MQLLRAFFFGLATAFLGLVAGSVVSFMLSQSLLLSIMAGVALFLIALWPVSETVIDAVRPVRSAFTFLLLRLAYSSLVIVLVYYVGLGAEGAFLSVVVARLAGVVLAFYWASKVISASIYRLELSIVRSLWLEWFRAAYSVLPQVISPLISSLDVFVVYHAAGHKAVAGFFAVIGLFFLASELFLQVFRYLHSYILSTGDYKSALNVLELSVLLVTPLLMYASLYPRYYVYLINPGYAWAIVVAPLAAYSSLVSILGDGLYQVLQGLVRSRGVGGARRLALVNVMVLLSSIVYIIVLSAGLVIVGGAERNIVAAWGVALVASSLLRIVAFSKILSTWVSEAKSSIGGNIIVSTNLRALVFYPLLSLTIAALVPPLGPPHARFWVTLKEVLPSVLLHYILCSLAFLAFNKRARKTARIILNKLPHSISPAS